MVVKRIIAPRAEGCMRQMGYDTCDRKVYTRGVCKSHYNMLAVKVAAVKTSWEEEELRGMVLPSKRVRKDG